MSATPLPLGAPLSAIAADSGEAAASSMATSLDALTVAAATPPQPPPRPTQTSSLLNENPELVDADANDEIEPLEDDELDALRDEIYSLIRHISDPEHPQSIEALGVVYKLGVVVSRTPDYQEYVDVEFKPTVPHCSLATLIGLCIRTKILQTLPQIKFSIHIQPGTHQTEREINKQLNDKERATAAMENPALRETVERLIKDTREFN